MKHVAADKLRAVAEAKIIVHHCIGDGVLVLDTVVPDLVDGSQEGVVVRAGERTTNVHFDY